MLVSKMPSAGWQWLLLLASTENSWLRYHDVLATTLLTVGINFCGWEIFMTAKSTTKITKISTP